MTGGVATKIGSSKIGSNCVTFPASMRLISPITVHPPELQSSTGGWGSYGTDDVVVDRHAGEMKGSGTTARLLGNNNNNHLDD